MPETVVTDCISAGHPALPGHFPGNPIVPGVVLLDRVIAAAERHYGPVSGLVSTKFVAPLRPQAPFTVTLLDKGPGQAEFRIESAAVLIATGLLEYTDRAL
jgi:3-hydroxyacyl-[acyl-carrier-protein] dehydratase